MAMLFLFGILTALAAGMALSTAVFVRWAAECRSALHASIVDFVLLMMTGMLAGALVYELWPSRSSAVAGLWLASLLMSASGAIVFVAFLREATRAGQGAPAPQVYAPTRAFVLSVVLLVLVNEALMGWTFGIAAGAIARFPAAGASATLTWFGAIVVSPWFLFTMVAEMATTAVLLRDRLGRAALVVIGSQAALMFASPPTLSSAAWTSGTIAASSLVMTGLFVYLMEYLYRRRSFGAPFARYLAALLPVYGVMMAGIVVWQLYGSAFVFATAILGEMVVYFQALVRPGGLDEKGASFAWPSAPAWTTSALASIFVAELFMGASLALLLEPATFLGAFSQLSLSGPLSTVLGNALANGFSFVVATTATTWFLAMMGCEMGALVVLKLRETRGRELRVRLGLMLACYAAFAVFYPSIYYGLAFPGAPGAAGATAVPVLGWSMGAGSAPLAAGVLGVLAATYGIFAAVTVLFGRRAVCSVFCTAAVMYQGTTVDAMKSFNRSSPLAHKYLGSRFSTAYSVTSAAILLALVGTSVTSYLDSVGTLHVTVGGWDPSVFLFGLSFGVLWYALFVTIPYAGDYNCVTMGWCYTGQVSGLVSRLGFFHLAVKDPAVCRACTTVECAKACPVGLVDMPGRFRSQGSFRSSKCCGIGGCAEACPYGNLYLADVRHAFARRLFPRRAPALGPVLPMAGRAAPRPPAAAPAPSLAREAR